MSQRESTGADEPRTDPAPWPRAAPFVRRTLLLGAGLSALAGLVTLLCIDALTGSGVGATGWVFGLLVAVTLAHGIAALLAHSGFFRDVLALDGVRRDARPDPLVVGRAFGRVVNAPRYWSVRALGWFVLAAFDLSLLRHALEPDGLPILQVVVRTAGAGLGGFLLAALLFFLLKRELSPLRSALGSALGSPEDARRWIQPVSIRSKLLMGVTGMLALATLYGAVLGQVRAERTAESTAVALGHRLLADVANGRDVTTVGGEARRWGLVEHLVVVDRAADPELAGLGRWLVPSEIHAIQHAAAPQGDSLALDSPRHFTWRMLKDGRLAVTIAPATLFGAHVASMRGALGIFLGVLWLMSFAVAWLLAADVARAVRHLTGEVERLASGDLRTGRHPFWEDELGGLAARLDHMARSLGGMIVGVRATADRVEVAAGGIGHASRQLLDTTEEQVRGNDALHDSIRGVTAQATGIRDAAGDLTASVEEGSSSILQLRGTGQQLDDNASLLSEKVDEVSSSVDELIRSVRDVLEHAEHLSGAAVDTSSSMEQMAASLREMDANATETARLSGDVVVRAEGGREKVRETVQGMEQIRETTQVARGVIRGLGDRTKEIGAIVEVIDDVAEETNLLALNAAIIAAQAGENGRAFTVVADEIKKLADRVLASTKEIEQVIGSVQSETANAIEAIERGSRVVDEGVTRADEAGGALEEITAAARDSGCRIGEIVVAVTEQTKAAAHVVSLMERVRAGVDHIRRAGQEQDRGNESMLASTEVLREIAERVRATTREQAQGSSRIADGVAAVTAAIARIDAALAEQRGACETAKRKLGAGEVRTHAQGQLAHDLDDAVGRMRESATQLRDAVGRFQV